MHTTAAAAAAVILFTASMAAQSSPKATIWLDRLLTSWNDTSDARVPASPRSPSQDDVRRCHLESRQSSAAERAVAAAGWIAFRPFDRALMSGDVEVVGGQRAATQDCGPAAFNLFVFVGGIYAGTLSPVEMSTAVDGVIGTVRFPPGNVLTAEFARYAATDTECCPSGRVRVTYNIDRQTGRAVVIPAEIRTIRQVPR